MIGDISFPRARDFYPDGKKLLQPWAWRDCASLRSLRTNPGSPVNRSSITFSIDGKQYVDVAMGPSGEANSTLRVTPELRPGTATQAVVVAVP